MKVEKRKNEGGKAREGIEGEIVVLRLMVNFGYLGYSFLRLA